jgi:hypothetical protein
MLTHPTLEKLKALRLDALATAWQAQQQHPALSAVPFDDRLGLLVDAEWLARENKRLQTALREAKLRLSQACVEDLDYAPRRELDKALVRQLATCGWVPAHQNVLITGATGTGKTYLACALAQQACRKGYRALYRSARSSRSRMPTGATSASSPASPGPTSSSSMTGASGRSAIRIAATSSSSSKIAPVRGRPSSRASSRRRSGTSTSPTPRSPTRSATGSSTPPTASC